MTRNYFGICLSLLVISSVKSELRDHEKPELEPTNDQEYEQIVKDQGKRTLFNGPTHLWGKHVGIHPSGFKYVLGYGPLDYKYVPVVKPVAFLKPVLQAHPIKFHVKSGIPPSPWYKTYFPPAPKPIINDWKPIIKPTFSIPSPVHEEVHVEKPVVHLPAPPLPPPIAPPIPVSPPLPVAPPLPAAFPLPEFKPPSHHYFFFQTPISRPQFIPQAPLPHVAKPALPVLPFGATFSAPVIHQNSPSFVPAVFPPPPQPISPTLTQTVEHSLGGIAPFQHPSVSGFESPWVPSPSVHVPLVPPPIEHAPLPPPQLFPSANGNAHLFPPNQFFSSSGHAHPPPPPQLFHSPNGNAHLLPPNQFFSSNSHAHPPPPPPPQLFPSSSGNAHLLPPHLSAHPPITGHAPEAPPPEHRPLAPPLQVHGGVQPPVKPSFVFHGNHQLLVNNQLPLPHLHHFQPSVSSSGLAQLPHPDRQYLPANHVENQEEEFHGIQPGQTDLQFPMHLPIHPNFNYKSFDQQQAAAHNTFCLATGSLHCRPQN